MKKNKSYILFIFSLFFFCANVNAQDIISHTNIQLRKLLEQTRPSGGLNYLHEMSAKITSDSLYTSINPFHVLNAQTWLALYDEVFHSAFDTTQLMRLEDLFNTIYSYGRDTIPFLVLDNNVYKLKPNALTSGSWFEFDTINTILTNKPNQPSSPFTSDNFFLTAPGKPSSVYNEIVFKIGSEYYFTDSSRQEYYTSELGRGPICKIDFDDGNGWLTFDLRLSYHHFVQYSSVGVKTIKCGIFDQFGDTITFGLSKLFIPDTVPITPNYTYMDFGLLDVYEFEGCNTGDPVKTVFYLEGFDIFSTELLFDGYGEKRSVESIFNQMIRNTNLINLLNFNYRFIIVKYKNSGVSIIDHAEEFAKLIEYYKCQQKNSPETMGDYDEFVVIGESMGGLVARYALTLMEHSSYVPTEYYCDTQRMHNTRLLITLDTPHKGANVPISLQYLYNDAIGSLQSMGMPVVLNLYAIMLKTSQAFLDAPAAREMLVYHINTASGLGTTKTFTHDKARSSFLNQLNALGNYPQYCKKVALVNGSLTAKKQYDPSDITGITPRIAGDHILKFDAQHSIKILFIRIPVLELGVEANTNFSGKIYESYKNICLPKLRLYWFGATIDCIPAPILSSSKLINATNLSEICVNAGSNFSNSPVLGSNQPAYYNDYYYFAGFSNISSGNGCSNVSTFFGLDYIFTVNSNLGFCSKGLNFSFVPSISAIDYATSSYDYNIYNDGYSSIMSKTPFDAIIGWPNQKDPNNLKYANQWHLEVNNYFAYDYQTCLPIFPLLFTFKRSHILNVEIGDEKFYLNNRKLPWNSTFRAEYEIYLNKIFPKYQISNILAPVNNENSYSKKAQFQGIGIPNVHLYADVSNGGVLPFLNPMSITLFRHDEPMNVCCSNYSGLSYQNKISNATTDTDVATEYDEQINIFPNPTSSVINIVSKNLNISTISLYSISGQKLIHRNFYNSSNQTQFDITGFPTGVYLLEIIHENGRNNYKIIID